MSHADSHPHAGRWSKIRAEPYRLLFPLGWIWALVATWHWVAFHFGWSAACLPLRHGYLQILEFGGCIATGFLMTALPFFLGANPARTWEVLAAPRCTSRSSAAWA